MKNIFCILSLLTSFVAHAADSPATIQNDTLQLGKTSAADKTLIFNKGSGSTNPKIKWNNSSSKLQFSNDGTNYLDFGAGSSGASNLLTNTNWEAGTAGWTASAGTYTTTNTAANIGSGSYSGSWDAAASADTLTSNTVTITSGDGISGQNVTGSCRFKCASGTCTHLVDLYDGTNVLSSQTITSSTSGFVRTSVPPVNAPASGSLYFRIRAAANEPILYVDDCYFGLSEGFNTYQLSQAQFAGSAYFATTASCIWSRTNTALGAFSTTAACPGPTIEASQIGSWQTTDADLPQVTINNLPPGTYAIHYTAMAYNGTGGTSQTLAINDGTTTSGNTTYYDSGTGPVHHYHGVAYFTYTTSGNRTFSLYGASNASGVVTVDNQTGLATTRMMIFRYPTTTEQAYRPDQIAWRVDANISGANPDLGSSDQTSYTGITDSGLTLTNNTGAITAQIPCSSTNSPTGTTCSVGNESIGVSFTVPTAGDVLACVSFTHHMVTGASGFIYGTFQIVETPSNAQTISQEGKSRIASAVGSASITNQIPHRLCGTFTFSSAGQKTLRLFYEQDVNATVTTNIIIGDASASVGQRDIHWEVYPINIQTPAPLLVGSVTSNSTGLERMERVRVASTCSASPCTITDQSGSWVSSITRSATGQYAVNFTASMFSSAPTCVCNANTGAGGQCVPYSPTTSSVSLNTKNASGAADADTAFTLLCQGPR